MNYVGLLLGSILIVGVISYFVGYDQGFDDCAEVERKLRDLEKFKNEK